MANVFSNPLSIVPLFMQTPPGVPEINYSAANFRSLIEVLFYSPGVCTPTSFAVTQADTAGWAIKVAPGYAATEGYFITSGGAITVNLTGMNTNPASTRTHRVYLLVQDSLNNGSGFYAQIAVGEDTGAGATLPPCTASLQLATFTISPGQSNIQNSHITARPRRASDAGGFVPLADYLVSTFASANTVLESVAPARLHYGSGRIHLSGALRRANGTAFTANSYTLGTLPMMATPKYDQHLISASSGNNPWRLFIGRDGGFGATINTGDDPAYLYLDGLEYEID